MWEGVEECGQADRVWLALGLLYSYCLFIIRSKKRVTGPFSNKRMYVFTVQNCIKP